MVFALYLYTEYQDDYVTSDKQLLGLYCTENTVEKAKKRWKSEMITDDGLIVNDYHADSWILVAEPINIDVDLWESEG